MWKQKLGICIGNRFPIPVPDVVKLVHKIGFDAISPVWAPEAELPAIVQTARECGMDVQSLHAPYESAAAMWSRDEAVSQPALEELLQSLEAGKQLQIPILVVHTWYGKEYTFCPDTLYFDHFETLVAHAEKLGVSIAFEHLEGPEYCAALMDHFQGHPTAGFCWDSGHECRYNPGWDFLNRYGDRLTMTHLNDNLGLTSPDGRLISTDDLHLFPGDGVIDWKDALQKLKASRKQEILNLELKIRPHGDRCALDLYSQIPLEQYFQKAYDNACRVLGAYFEDQA